MSTWGDAVATWGDATATWAGRTDEPTTLTLHGRVIAIDIRPDDRGATVTVRVERGR